MMTVDGYFKQNGKQFISMWGYDGERSGGMKITHKEPRKVEACDLYGRKYEGIQIFSDEE